MSTPVPERAASDVAALLASERTIAAQPDDLRWRALLRARAAMAAAPVVEGPTKDGATKNTATKNGPIKDGATGVGPWRWAFAALGVLVVATLATAGVRLRRDAAAPPTSTPPRAAPRIAAPEPALTTFEPEAAPPAQRAPAPSRRALTPGRGYALELALLQPARAALAREDYAATLAATAEHERRFPAGQLTEERDALRVLALAGERRVAEAARAARAFRARFPRSLLLNRVEDAVSGTP